MCVQKSIACRDGHRLILYIDACFSGHWALKAQQLCLPNVIVQTSCSDTETSLDGVFTKAFVDFQNSKGASRPSSDQLYSRTPFVYVPWSESEGDSVIYKESRGSADRSRPYMHLLFDKHHVYRLDRSGVASSAAAEAQRRLQAEVTAAELKRAQAAAATAEAQCVSTLASSARVHSVTTPLPEISVALDHRPSQTLRLNQSTVAGIEWAATHDCPNEDLSVTGAAGGWPPRLFGPERSRALISNGITTFSQLMAEVNSRTKEDFYRKYGTCENKVGVLDTAANTMWEVCKAWKSTFSIRPQPIPVTPVKLPGGGTAAATPGSTQQPGRHNMTNRTSELESLLKQMQIEYKTLRAAAAGRSASQHGLNMPEMKHVLNHFKMESSGKREDLNLKLSGLLISLEMK
jgi:hypothetical protein